MWTPRLQLLLPLQKPFVAATAAAVAAELCQPHLPLQLLPPDLLLLLRPYCCCHCHCCCHRHYRCCPLPCHCLYPAAAPTCRCCCYCLLLLVLVVVARPSVLISHGPLPGRLERPLWKHKLLRLPLKGPCWLSHPRPTAAANSINGGLATQMAATQQKQRQNRGRSLQTLRPANPCLISLEEEQRIRCQGQTILAPLSLFHQLRCKLTLAPKLMEFWWDTKSIQHCSPQTSQQQACAVAIEATGLITRVITVEQLHKTRPHTSKAIGIDVHDVDAAAEPGPTYHNAGRGQLSSIALNTVHECKQQILLDCHEAVPIGGLHVETQVDLAVFRSQFVQEHTAVQLVNDAAVITHNAPDILHGVRPDESRQWPATMKAAK